MRAAKEVREFWDVDVCMTKAFSNERLEATSGEGGKVALLKEQTEALTKGCRFKFPMLGRIDMFSKNSLTVARPKLKLQLEKIIEIVTAPDTAAQYEKPAEATAVFTSRTLNMPKVGTMMDWRMQLDAKDQKEAEEAQEAAGQPDKEHEELIAKYVGLKFWDCDHNHKEMMIVRIVTVKIDGQEYYQAECVKIKRDGAVHDSHPVITDASKDQGLGFFGGMEPYVFDMEWVTNDEGNFDAMHELYKQKVADRRARDVRSPRSTPGHKAANSRTNRSQRSNRQRR